MSEPKYLPAEFFIEYANTMKEKFELLITDMEKFAGDVVLTLGNLHERVAELENRPQFDPRLLSRD